MSRTATNALISGLILSGVTLIVSGVMLLWGFPWGILVLGVILIVLSMAISYD